MLKRSHRASLVLIVLPLLAAAAQGEPESVKLESLVVRKLSPTSESAVLQYPDGGMKVVRSGEPIPGTGAVVLQVLEDRLLARLAATHEGEPESRQWVWLHKATGRPLRSRIQLLDREPPPPATVAKPRAETVKEELPPGAELKMVRSDGGSEKVESEDDTEAEDEWESGAEDEEAVEDPPSPG